MRTTTKTLNIDASLTLKTGSVHDSQDSELGTLVPDELPEGGWRAWRCVAGAFCIQMVGLGLTGSFGVYQDYYSRFYMTEENPSAIAWIGSTNAFFITASGIFAGRLYDKGYFYYLLYGGSTLIVFSLFMLSLSQPNHLYQNFLTQGVGHGLGAGLMFVPSLAITSQYFLKQRALAMSIVTAGSSFGSIIHPIMLNNLFPRLGFGNTVRANAGMTAGLLILACLLLRTRQPPPTTVAPIWKSVRKFSTDWPYVICVLGLMSLTIGIYFPSFYLQLDAMKRSLGDNFAFYALVILNATSFFGRISPGFFSRFISVPILAVMCALACSALMYAVIGITAMPTFIVFGILFGYFSGAVLSLSGPLISVLSVDTSEIGLRMGVGYAMFGLGALVGSPVQGALLGEAFVWLRPAVFSASFCLLAAIMFGTTTVLLRRRNKFAAENDAQIPYINNKL